MKLISFIVFLFLVGKAYGQSINAGSLTGQWTTCNDDSLYYKSDTVIFYQDINHRTYTDKPCCENVNWNLQKKGKFKLEFLSACSEPGTVRSSENGEKLKVSRKGDDSFIELKSNNGLTDRFKVLKLKKISVDRYPWEIQILTLRRAQ